MNGIKLQILHTSTGKMLTGFSKDGKDYRLTNLLNTLNNDDYTIDDLTEYITMCEGAEESIAILIDDAISHSNKKDCEEYSKMCEEIISLKNIVINKLNVLV